MKKQEMEQKEAGKLSNHTPDDAVRSSVLFIFSSRCAGVVSSPIVDMFVASTAASMQQQLLLQCRSHV
jgi:hypothetical protein